MASSLDTIGMVIANDDIIGDSTHGTSMMEALPGKACLGQAPANPITTLDLNPQVPLLTLSVQSAKRSKAIKIFPTEVHYA